MVQIEGIEPSLLVWKTRVLPLNDICMEEGKRIELSGVTLALGSNQVTRHGRYPPWR